MDSFSQIPKKKRFSEHKANGMNYKISYSLKKNDFSYHQNQKSTSMNKNKNKNQLRLHTDYTDNQYNPIYHNTNYLGAIKSTINNKKNTNYGLTGNLKRKDSQNKQQNKINVDQINLSNYKLSKQMNNTNAIYSTKYDSKKNNDIRLLFNNPYESKIKNHKKTKQSNHNFSVFLNPKQKKQSINNRDYILNSPYNQQINNFMKISNQRSSSKNRYTVVNNQNQTTNNVFSSKQKQKTQINIKDILLKQSLSKLKNKNKKSTNKYNQSSFDYIEKDRGKRQEQGQLNLLTKNNIRLKTTNAIDQDDYQYEYKKVKVQTTKDTKQHNTSQNKYFSKKSTQNYNQDNNPNNNKSFNYYQSNNNNLKNKQFQQQQQSTVKTIKKQDNCTPNHKNNKSQLRQLQSSRITSQNQSDIMQDNFGLTQEQIQTFGDRFPYGFEKIKLLGRGGFSLVWLGKHIKSGKQFAIKQIITNNTHQTHIKEIWFGTMYFTLGGIPKPQFSTFPGVKNLVRLYSYQINQTDTWIFYQKCGKSLGTTLYDIKSQKIYGDQKLYKIHYKPFYLAMQKNPSILASIIVQICKSLALLSQCQIVHSDLKTQNILIKFNQDKNFQLTQLKLIDYGSSFQFKNIAQFSMATPQYMPPEILNYIIHQNQGVYEEQLYEQVMNNYQNPWAVDIWSLGCVVLQIVVGVPLWMSLPLLVPNKIGKSYLQKQGLFAVKGRLFPQIIAKQRQVISRLNSVLQKQNYSRIVLSSKMKKVLKGMLQIDFNKRISPTQIIELLKDQAKSI